MFIYIYYDHELSSLDLMCKYYNLNEKKIFVTVVIDYRNIQVSVGYKVQDKLP